MKHVFHIITHLDVGGAERVAFNIAKSDNPAIEYHIVEVVHSSSEFSRKIINELTDAGIIVHCSPYSIKKYAILMFWIWFKRLYIDLKPDVIHVHTEIPDLALWVFRKIAWTYFWIHPIYIRTIHNTELWNGWKGIGKFVERFYIRHHCNVAISQSTKECYERAYGEKNIPIIYNGLEEVVQKPFDQIVKGKVNVLFAGRLEWQKGVDELLEVIVAFKNSNNLHFHIVGEGSYLEKIKTTIGTFSNVSLYDKIYGLSQYLGSFDYLFMPSNHEGLALMPIEASLAHTPTVINRCPGLRDTLPEDWPLAVDGNSVDAFIEIFSKDISEEKYKELSGKAYMFAKENFSLKKMQREYEQLYQNK